MGMDCVVIISDRKTGELTLMPLTDVSIKREACTYAMFDPEEFITITGLRDKDSLLIPDLPDKVLDLYLKLVKEK